MTFLLIKRLVMQLNVMNVCVRPDAYTYTSFTSEEAETMAAVVDVEKCTGCESCVPVCPVEAIVMENGKAVISEDDCIECGVCVDECPEGAISMPG